MLPKHPTSETVETPDTHENEDTDTSAFYVNE